MWRHLDLQLSRVVCTYQGYVFLWIRLEIIWSFFVCVPDHITIETNIYSYIRHCNIDAEGACSEMFASLFNKSWETCACFYSVRELSSLQLLQILAYTQYRNDTSLIPTCLLIYIFFFIPFCFSNLIIFLKIDNSSFYLQEIFVGA